MTESLAYTGNKANNYDKKRENTNKWKKENHAVAELIGTLEEIKTVLDVPVGTGRFIPGYKALGWEVTGVDLSADMLRIAKDRGCDHCAIGDIRNLKVEEENVPEVFDLSVCIRLTNWLSPEDLKKAVQSLANVSRYQIIGIRTQPKYQPKGRLHKHSLSYFLSCLESAGLVIKERRAIKEGSYSIYLCEPNS